MDWNLKITDMAGATPEHSSVIVNFVAAVRYQLKNSTVMFIPIMYSTVLKMLTEIIRLSFLMLL